MLTENQTNFAKETEEFVLSFTELTTLAFYKSAHTVIFPRDCGKPQLFKLTPEIV